MYDIVASGRTGRGTREECEGGGENLVPVCARNTLGLRQGEYSESTLSLSPFLRDTFLLLPFCNLGCILPLVSLFRSLLRFTEHSSQCMLTDYCNHIPSP